MLPMKLPIFANHDEMVNIFVAVEISIINYFALVNNNLRKNKKYKLQTAYKIRIYNYGVLKLIRNFKRMKIYYTEYEYEISSVVIYSGRKDIWAYIFGICNFILFQNIYIQIKSKWGCIANKSNKMMSLLFFV